MKFRYQKLTDPFAEVQCLWEMVPENPYDRRVDCEIEGSRHSFIVHLAISFYPKTVAGVASYELLYWVTDMTDTKSPRNSSLTMWIHNSLSDNRIRLLESNLGIEDDLAYLKLEWNPATSPTQNR